LVVANCTATTNEGKRCRAAAMRGESECFLHNPEKAEEAADARRLGGIRRKREKTLAGAYEITGLDTTESIRRLVFIATIDALGLDNSIARARVLLSAALAAAKLLEVGELEARIEVLEAASYPSPPTDPFAD
jgi:hypothetical protein